MRTVGWRLLRKSTLKQCRQNISVKEKSPRREHFTSSPGAFVVFCNLASDVDEVKISHCCRDGHERTVKTVEHASVSGKDVSGILDL